MTNICCTDYKKVNNTTEFTCPNDCSVCEIARNKINEILIDSESIFDAVSDYNDFISDCKKKKEKKI